ncbi:MAG: transposase [Bdellovibrionales bacterium]|nr:transposase [Bdellovibrionales bacterium]
MRKEPFFQNGGGYRKLTKYLRRNYGFIINKKKVYRLCLENGLCSRGRLKDQAAHAYQY